MKVGIITHYYNSTNYGGVLQSYALCKFFKDNGIDAVQICYDSSKRPASTLGKLKHFTGRNYRKIIKLLHPKVSKQIDFRKNQFVSFRNSIPHTDKIFDYKNIYQVSSEFDAFIAGSDQVWNPTAINIAYSLSFTNKPKYSYAASIASNIIPESKKNYYNSFLKSFDKISVRERKAQELLSVNCELVLDPVFLIKKEEWIKLASKRIINEKYIFCYFLGDSTDARNQVEAFAEKNKLKIVTIPYLMDNYRKCDNYFGDYKLFKITPNDFLSLILNSEYVITDSFHAICLSYILNKEFIVFNRTTESDMSSRIKDILFTLNLEDKFIKSNVFIQNDVYQKIDYDTLPERFIEVKQQSIKFIQEIIKGLRNE